MIPESQQPASPRSAGDGTGWAREIPLSNPPGTGPGSPADRIVDEFDRRDRAELIERGARLQTMETLAEQTETMRQQTEALAKLVEEPKP